MMVDNSDQSVFAFEREVGESDLLFVYNMTPNYYETYDVGCAHKGLYEEIFNSDKDIYGGWNQYNGLPSESQEGGPENRPYHVSIKLGSYAACILKRKVAHLEREVEPEKPAEAPKEAPQAKPVKMKKSSKKKK
jgi:1,4-alpha-glucan branching enzyme